MIDPLQGRVIEGRYELQERLGAGAMGSVYRAHQRIVDRPVAVKILHAEAAQDPEYRERFEREARALGKLDHPGCVRVHDFGYFAEIDAPYLVSEFVDGVPLFEYLDGSLAIRERLKVIRDIASAMSHAHRHHIIHRDLKPENIIAAPDTLTIKVVDFGLARLPRDEEIRLTQAGDTHGTPAYMSPEQCRGEGTLTPACDVYSLGCMLFELFEGHLPFLGSTASAVLIKHVTDPVPAQRSLATPAPIKDLITAMMAKEPLARPSMDEVVTTIDKELAETDERATSPQISAAAVASFEPGGRTDTLTTLSGVSIRGRRPLVAVLVALLSLVAVAAFVVVTNSEPRVDPADQAADVAPAATVEGPAPTGQAEVAAASPEPAKDDETDGVEEPPTTDEPQPTAAVEAPAPKKTERVRPQPREDEEAAKGDAKNRRRDSVKLTY